MSVQNSAAIIYYSSLQFGTCELHTVLHLYRSNVNLIPDLRMSSTSDSSATEYRRRLPEIPRAVKFSGDVLHRIDDVAEKIDHVGNRMKQVENLMADYQGPR